MQKIGNPEINSRENFLLDGKFNVSVNTILTIRVTPQQVYLCVRKPFAH